MNDQKLAGALRSRTMWAAMLLTLFGAAQAGLPSVKEFIPPEVFGYINMLFGVVVAWLRWVTTVSIDQR